MNKGRYRLVFSEEKGGYVPVPEETKACGKGGGARALRRVVAAMAAALPGLAIANPTGHQVIHGNVGVQVQGSTLNITASDKAIINWQQFSIQPGETTRFIQPSSTASVLNRVVGQDPSRILGNLIANGRVFLINPNGVLFGAGAKVDTAGLVASTLNIRNEDFLAGRMKFDADGNAGKLRNDGTLKTTGGPLILIATDVENTGLITAENGDIVLAAGKSVEIADPHQPSLRVKIEAGGEAINLGQLIARGGSVGMFGAALTQAGKISATGAHRTEDGRIVLRGSKSVTLTAQSETVAQTADGAGGAIDISAPEVRVDAGAQVDASGTEGGRIEVSAEQRATVEGTLRAVGRVDAPAAAVAPAPAATTAPASVAGDDLDLPVTAAGPAPAAPVSASLGQGGDIVVTAQTVVLDGDAVLDASGDTGGGSILVGGDWQGANAAVSNAHISWVGHGVSLLSDALLNGDGGKVVVWADEATAFAGSIWARGGRDGGDGGQVEVSGKVALLYRGRTDTRAERGRNGELLLDPLAIIIQGGTGDGSNDGSLIFSGGTTPGTITADALGPTVIFESEIEEQSKTTDIILRAQRSVTVGSNQFNYTASGNVAGETAGQLALASNSSLLIETRNLGVGEGGASAGIDLVTGGAHGAALQITTRGDGDITLQTGYSNGEKVGNQIANVLLPVLGSASGSILVRTSDGSTVQLLGAGYTSGGSIQIVAATVTGGATLSAAGGTQIIGNYVASSGTLAFQGGASSISGTLTLTGNLGGDAALTLGGLDWRGGRMLAGGAVSLTGAGVIDNTSAYRYLARRLNVSGSLSLENSSGYYLDVEAGGTLHLNAGGALTTGTANGLIYLAAGNGGTAALSADAGAVVDVGGGTTLNLRGDSTTGNLISGVFSLAGDGALLLDSGLITTGADTTISGSGLLRMTNGGALGGSHLLTIASDFEWLGGAMSGTGTTVLSGSAQIDNTSAYKYLNRRLELTGNLAFGNNSGYYLQVGNGGTLHLGATGSLTTTTSNGLLNLSAGSGGVAAFTAAAGSVIDVADGTSLTLRTDGSAGNRMSGTFGLSGDGAMVFDSGLIDVSAATRFEGAGRFRFAGGTITGAGALTIDSLFDWAGGTFSGTGVTVVSGSAVIDNTSAYKFVNRRVEVSGDLTFGNSTGYYLQIGNGGTLHLLSGGQLATAGTSGFIYMAAGASGVARLSADAGSSIALSANTLLTIRSDGNTGNQIGGTFGLTGAGATYFDSGTFATSGATNFTGAGLLRVGGGTTLNLNHSTAFGSPFRFENGVLGGSGAVDIGGAFTWAGGTMSGTGTTVLSGNGVIDNTSSYKFLNRRLELEGGLSFGNSNGYYLQIGDGGTLHLTASGQLSTATVNGLIYLAAGAGGTARISADAGSDISTASDTLLTLRSDSNTGNQISGTFGLTGAGELVFDSGLLTTAAATHFTGPGSLRISGSNIAFNHASTVSSALRFSSGTISGSGNLAVSGPFIWAGGTMSGTGTTLLSGSTVVDNTSAYKFVNRSVEVSGTVAFGNSSGYYVQVGNGGTLHLLASGQLATETTNGLIYLAAGSGGTAVLSAAAGADISVADGTALILRSDSNTGNLISGTFALSGAGSFHFDSGVISANSDTTFTGSGELLISSGATLAGSALVTIASGFDWTGGIMSGTGTTRLVNAVSLTGSGTRSLNRTLEIAAGGSLDIGDNVVIQRSTSNGGTGRIVALGTLTKSSGSGTAYIQYLDLQGNLASSSGILSLYGNAAGTTLGSASFSTSGTGLMRMDSGLFTLTNGQTATVTAGTLDLSGATLSTAGTSSIIGAGTFLLSSGTLDGAGTLNISSGFNWTAGTMSGAGVTRLVSDVSLTGSGTRTLNRTLEISAGASLNLGNDVLIQRATSNGGTGGIVALGSLTKSSGTGTAYVRYLDLRGNISSSSGTLSIYGNTAGSSINGAVFSTTGSGVLSFDSGLFTLNTGESASVAAGIFDLSGGTLSTTGDSTFGGAGTLRFTSGTISGIGRLTVNAGFDWSAGTQSGLGVTRLNGESRILSGGTKALNRTLEISGSTRVDTPSGTVQIQDSGRLSVLDTGQLEIVGGSSISHLGSGRLDNAGLMRKTGTAGLTLAMPLTNIGTLRIESGTLTASAFPVNAGTLDVFDSAALITANNSLQNNGVIQGGGAINLGAGTLTNAGALRPGNGAAAGTLAITGNLIQTAAGLIEADVLGTTAAQQDHVTVTGSATLDGDLVLSPSQSLTFGAQDRYTVLSCGAEGCLSGSFSSIETGGLAATATFFSNALSFATGTIASTWISTTSGFWDVAANWANSLIPGEANDVIIDQAGDLTITVRATAPVSSFRVNSLYSNENITIAGSTLTLIDDSVINGRLTMSGGTLNIGTQLDTGSLAISGGTISGGRLFAAGGSNVMTGGTLNSLQMMIGAQFNASGGTLANVTLSKLGSGIGAGQVLVGANGDLRVVGALTLDNADITLASDGSSTFLRSITGPWSIGGNGSILFGGSHNAVRANNYLGYGSGAYSLSIGSGVTVAGANGGYIYFGNNGVNAGTISANTAGKEISLNSWATTDTWTNSGTVRANGGILSTNDTWSSTGTLQLDSGILFLGGSFNTASFNTLVRPADADRGSLNLVGTLNNANSTLLLDGSTGTLAFGGNISSGTVRINNANGGALNTGYAGFSGSSFGGSNTATLTNVTLGNIANVADSGHLTIANNGDLRVVGALTLDNADITLASDGSSTFLRSITGPWSIGGNGSILFGGSHNAVRANNYLGYGSGAYSLSIGSGVTVAGANGGYIYFGNNGVNAGTISANTAGKEISLNSWATTDTWTNSGTVRANGGILSTNDTWSSTGTLQLDSGILFLGGSFNTASFNTLVRPADADRGSLNLVGTLNNANSTLLLDGSTGTLAFGGNISSGTVRINNANGGALNTGYAGFSGSSFGGSNTATLTNVTLGNIANVADSGHLTIANNGDLRVVGALTLDNADITLASDGSSTFLRSITGPWSIGGNGSILFGGSHNAVRANNYLGYGSGAYSLSIGSGVTVAGANGGYIYFGNNGVNAGTISANTAGKEISLNSWATTDTWTNSGTVRANGGILSTNDTWSSTGTLQLDSGILFLGGSFNTASFNTLVRPADADRGSLNLVGTLNNANSTLLLDGSTGTLAFGGNISSGTVRINNANGGALNTGYAGFSGSSFGGSNTATLTNVTLGNIANVADSGHLTIANNGDLRVVGALTLDNADITLASDGSSTFLRSITGPWSIGGNGSILFGGSHNAVRANNYLGYGSGAYSLSIGSGVTVAGANGGYIYFGNNGVNAGTISANTAGKEISLNSWATTDTWTNSGTLSLAGGQMHSGDSFVNAGMIRGIGNLNLGSNTLTNAGTLFADGGLLNLTGNLVLTAGSTLRFDIGGLDRVVDHGALDVNGAVTFGGTLRADHVNGYVPGGGSETFQLIRYTSRTGSSQFATLNVPNGFGYDSYYGVGTYLLGFGNSLIGINEWISNTSGDWATATNWSLGVAPNSPDMAVLIDRVGFTPTITISSGDWTIEELISEEHLTISGGSLTTAYAYVGGNLILNGSGRMTVTDEIALNNVTLNNSSQFIADGAGQIANYVQNNGTSTFNAASLAFDAIDVRGGTVNYNAALALPSSLLRVAGYTANLNADQGQTLIQVVSGTLNLNLASLTSDIELSGSGVLNVANSTSASGDLTWTGGNIGGGGTLTLAGVLDVSGSNSFGLSNTVLVHANASGLSRIAKSGGYFYLNGTNGILRNSAGASLTIDTTGGNSGTYYSGGTGGTLHNLGTLNKTGTGTFFIYNPTHLEQAGVLNIQQGVFNLDNATHALSGLTTLAADSSLDLSSGSSIAVSGTARFTGDGVVRHNSATVTLGNGARIDADYALAGGTLNIGGAAVMNGDLAWTGGIITGDLVAPGTLTLNGVLSQTGNTTVYLRNGTQLVHANTSGASRISNTSGSGFNIEFGATFRNTGTLTIDIQNAGSIMYIDHDSGAAGTFENTGTLTKVGAGRVDFGNFGQLQLVQQGSFLISEGLVTLGNTVALNGTVDIAADATLRVLGGTTTIGPNADVTGAGVLDLASGTLSLGNGADIDARQVISGGTLTVAAGSSATFSNALSWTAGTINGGGTVNASGVFNQSGNTTVYLRDGTLFLHSNASGNSRIANTSSSGFNLENGAIFRNTGALTLDVAGAASNMYIDQDSGPAIGRFENIGTLTKTGAGRLDFGNFGIVQLFQQGTLAVNQGLVTLGGTGSLSGTQQIASGAELRVTSGSISAAASAVFGGTGVLSLTGGTLAFADGLDTGITLQQSGGNFEGTGNNTLSGRYEWTGGNVAGSGALTVSGILQLSGASSFGLAGRSLVHTNGSGSSSLFKTSGYFYIGGGASFTNATGARLYFDTGSGNPGLWYSTGAAGSFINQGTLTKVGSGTLYVYNPVGLQNPGTLILGQGSVIGDGFNQNAGTLQLLPGTIFSTASSPLTNTGLIAGHGVLITGGTGLLNQGTVSPGGAGSIGTLNITGRYAQDATGTLQIERGNAGADALIVSSTATLGGTLVVSELPGYIATGGTSDVVTASALSGSFSTVTLPSGYSTQTVGNRQVLSYAGAICGGVCWDGGGGSLLWTDAANWTGDLLPGTNDLVFIDLGTISVQLTNGSHTIRSLNTASGNTLIVSGGSLTVTDVATLAGDLVISGGTANFNGAAQLARLMLSSGIFGGSGAVTFSQSGSTWTGGDVGGTGRLVFAAGSTFNYAAGTRTITRRLDIEQGGRFSLDSGSLTTTGGAGNAGVVNVAFGATARYGGSATYLLDATGQFDGGGRIEFINTAQVTSATNAPAIADNTFTVRVQDSARFTLSTPGAIANLELADSGQVIAQAGLQVGSVTQTGGTLTLNAASGASLYNWNGGTLAGSSTFSIVGAGSWTRGTLIGNLVIANGASLTLSGTGSDDVQSTSYKRFGAGSLTNFGTLNWLEGHIDVIGAGRVDNHGLIDLASDFSFGDRSTGTGTFTLVNHNSGVISKTAGTGEFAIGTLGIPGGTANYTNFTNNGRINVFSGRLRFNIGYSGASGGGTFTHNNFIAIGADSTLEIGGALTYNGDADLGAGGVLRRLGGFTINSGADVFGNGTIDVGASGTLTNAGALGTLEYGTLSVTGNFVQTDTGVLDLWIGGTSAGTYDQLAVSGSVTLGGTLVVTEDPSYTRGPLSLALITAGSGISGTFATIDTPVAGYTTAVDGNAFRISFGSIVCGGICWDGGAGTALWTDAANWSGDALPGLNDLVFIALDNGSSVVLNSGSHTIAGLTTTAGNALSISAGSLTLTGMSALAGDLTLSGSGTLVTNGRLDATRFTQTGGTFNGPGDFFVSTAFSQTGGSHTGIGRTMLGSAVSFAPGSYTFNRDFDIEGTLNHTSGTLVVAANRTVTVDGALNWTSGSTITGSGTLLLAEGSVSTLNANTNGGHLVLSGITVNNAGTVNYTSEGRQVLINDGTTFNNTGRFNFASDGVVSENSGNGGNFNNSGTLAKTGGTGTSGFASQVRFNNLDGGTVDSGTGTGTISLQTQGAHAGVFNLVGNGVQFNAGAHSFANGATITGSANFSGAAISSGNTTFNGPVNLSGGTITSTGTLTLDGGLNWNRQATITGGTLNLAAGTTSTFNANTNGGHLVLSGVTLNNAGTVNYTSDGRQLLINDGTTFNNSGRFNFASDGNVSENAGFGGTFNNSGTVAKTGGTGSSGFANFARFNNLNGGIVDSGTGTILLQTDGSHDGVFDIAGSNVRFNASTHTFAAGATIQGIANFAGATINTAGATINGPVNLSGGSINQNSNTTLTLNNGLNWTSGASIAGGTLDLIAGSTSSFNAHTNGGNLVLADVTVNNAGTVNYTSAGRELLINGGTRFNNSGRFNFASDGNLNETAGFGGHFNNSGTLAKTGGTGVSSFSNFVRFNSLDGGVVDSGTGLIVLQTEGNHAGAFNIVGNGVQFSAGVHTFASGSTINGRTHLAGATINTSGATFNGPVFLSGGLINIASSSTLTMGSGLNWASSATISGGTLNLASGSASTFNASTNGGNLVLSSVTVNNAGTVDYISAGRELLINDNTRFNNTGRFNFASDGVVSENSGNGGTFNNSGTLAKTGGTGSSGFASQARLVDEGGSYRGETGTLQLASLGTVSGVMHIAAGASITTASALTNTGVIEGSGTLDVGGGTLTNSGTVRPGGDDQIGRLTVLGNVTQTAAGRIEAEFAGTATNQFDVLDVRGDTLLDGVLEVQSLGAAVPVEGMQLPVITASGTLDTGALQLVAPTGFTTRTLGSSLSLGYTACTTGICWDGGAGSQLWTDAANWTGDVLPGVNDLVFITLAGGANVVLNAIPTVTVAGLTIGNANSLTLTGGVLNAPTTVQPGGTLSLDGGNLNFGNALLNNGTLNYNGGTMSGNVFTNNGTLNVLSGSVGNLTTTRLNNNGSVIIDSGATFEFGNGGGMIFANNGSVDVESGTLSVLAHDTDAAGPGADSGAYSVDSGATLRFRDAFRDFGPGSSITGPGDVEFTAFSGGVFNVNGSYNVGGETRVSGNTLVNFNSNATFGDLRVAGNIGGNGALTMTDDLIWTSGSIGGNGRAIVVRGDTVLDGSNLALNGAVLNIGGSGLLDTGTQLALNGGSQLIVSDGASLGLGSNTSVGGTGSLVNRGTLEGTLGGGTSNVAVRLVNDGNVQASAGNLGLTGGIGGGGLFVIGDNATMELGGDLPPDIFNRIGGNGTLSFSPTSAPVINQTFAATGGTPLLFSLRSGATLSSGPNNGVLDGQQSAWQYTANAGFNGNDSARFTLSLGSGTAQINVNFAVTSAPAVTQPEVQVITTTLLPEIFQPPRIALPSTPSFTPAPIVNIAGIDALSEIVTASGPTFEQPLREFSASRLQCR
ncbi:hypothetical protein BSY238_2488 [Methyloversatilis sp. RAC08]|uniref:filamentous hemagglutinin N-terminal domain-containing protein n=1 Tax=Methyloversatilis sp. RAC08 TaxID=1842540 RepID=UPI00083CFBA7|nr:filamentous hemagglutinin N-terminal domain-containing protein [Methyloversatilis sp. RAC08]AOF82424.1 hypothetical protein BSY238_2488 [Methyloversatilis sp. RAC08]